MAILFKNNAASTLTYKMTDVQEVLYVADASVFPVIASDSGDVFKLTLVGDDTLEIVEAFEVYNLEGRQGFKIRRAQEGTTAQAWPAGTRVEMRITADALNSFVPTAVQIAKDYVDATGVASTTNVGFAGVDGKTTQANAEGVVTAKDVAIGGDASDLASARGFFYDRFLPWYPGMKETPVSDFNSLVLSGKYHVIVSKDTLNRPDIRFFTGSGTNDGILEITRISSASTVSSHQRMNQRFTVFGSDRKTWSRNQNTNAAAWSAWEQEIRTGDIGDGIHITNGIISVPEYDGATASTSGTSGLVPPAAAGQQESFLNGGGEYKPALTKISDSVSLEDSTTAASAKAVKTAYDLANGKQANLGFTPVQQGGGTGQGSDKIYIGYSESGLKAQADTLDLGNVVTTSAGCTKAPSAALADDAEIARTLVVTDDGQTAKFNWAGRSTGQPEWVWGGNAAEFGNMYTWNPINFSVNYSTNSSNAWQTTVVPNVKAGDNNNIPAGGTWTFLAYSNGQVEYGAVAGGTYISGRWIAIRNA